MLFVLLYVMVIVASAAWLDPQVLSGSRDAMSGVQVYGVDFLISWARNVGPGDGMSLILGAALCVLLGAVTYRLLLRELHAGR